MARDDGFLNVDLEVGASTRARLAPLSDVLDRQLFQLFRGRLGSLYRAHYESTACSGDASATIRALVDVIEALPPPAMRAWKAAAKRDFNIGVELARGVRSIELALDPAAIERVVALGGRIAFTAYQEAAMAAGGPPKPRATPRSAGRSRRPPAKRRPRMS